MQSQGRHIGKLLGAEGISDGRQKKGTHRIVSSFVQVKWLVKLFIKIRCFLYDAS